MNIRPLYDRVVVKRPSGNARRHPASIPDYAAEKPEQGEVIVVG